MTHHPTRHQTATQGTLVRRVPNSSATDFTSVRHSAAFEDGPPVELRPRRSGVRWQKLGSPRGTRQPAPTEGVGASPYLLTTELTK